jgi:hypothetical protein
MVSAKQEHLAKIVLDAAFELHSKGGLLGIRPHCE